MKICVVGLRGIPGVAGGIETHCEQLYGRLGERGSHEIVVVGRSAYVGQSPYSFAGNVQVVPLFAMRHTYFEAVSNTVLAVLFARFRLGCDVLHIHGIGPGLLLPLARLLGMRTVLTHHGDDYARAKWNIWAKLALRLGEQLGVRFSNAVIAVSPSLAERLRKQFQGSPARIQYIPNGADHMDEPGTGESDLLVRHGLTPFDYVISVGRLVPEKGFHELIEGHRKSGVATKLVIVGGPGAVEYEKQLHAMAGDNVVFTGSLPRKSVSALLRSARLFILASHHEGLPIAALEAAAAGAPILLSDIVPNRDLGLPERHYFRVGDTEDLAARLPQALKDLPRSDLSGEFSWDSVARKTADLYDRLQAAPKGRIAPAPIKDAGLGID